MTQVGLMGGLIVLAGFLFAALLDRMGVWDWILLKLFGIE